jgi:hypothetical protein
MGGSLWRVAKGRGDGLDSLFWGESSTLQIAMRGQSGLTVLEAGEITA